MAAQASADYDVTAGGPRKGKKMDFFGLGSKRTSERGVWVDDEDVNACFICSTQLCVSPPHTHFGCRLLVALPPPPLAS